MAAADEPDGVDETFDGMLRFGLTGAGQMAEVYARHREQQARDARAASEQEARELGARLYAERAAARAQLAPVQRSEWWDQAQPDQVAQAWQTARAWEQHDPDAARAVDRIRHEVQDRHGIDVDELTGQRSTAGRDDAEAARLLAEAERADQTDRADALIEAGSDSYDTADRRRDLAASLDGSVDEETAQARVVADTFQARPAADALNPTQGGSGSRGRRVPAGRTKHRTETLGR